MQRVRGQTLFSPSDLTEFMESGYASWMSRLALEHPDRVREVETPPLPVGLKDIDAILAEHGMRHEREVLARLQAEGRDVAQISDAGDRAERVGRTLEAMRAGREVIYQAALERPPFTGVADFLIRVERESTVDGRRLAHSYEVRDAKLARRAKPYFVIQLCAYAEMLEAIQGHRPERIGVFLGTGEERLFRTDDFFFYYRELRRRFLAVMEAFDPKRPPVPEAGAEHRRWRSHAEAELAARDHVSQVAGITSGQVRRLAACGIETVADLAHTSLDRVPRMAPASFERLREQAGLQLESRGLERPAFRVLRPDEADPRKGLSSLPPASPKDVYFDLEGYPLVEGGLEYLFGAVHEAKRGDKPEYRAWWAHDPRAERQAFEHFVDWIHARWHSDPAMHVYHYAPYEVTALRRLMGRYGTREDAMDDLLRAQVFVDLYAVVRHGVRVGEPSYSIKNLERLYRAARGTSVTSGLESVSYYEAWLAHAPADPDASRLLDEICAYNRDDCLSTRELARWLRERQGEAGIAWLPPGGGDDEKAKRPDPEEDERVRRLVDALLAGWPWAPEERAKDPDHWQMREMLGHLAEFHHREMRPSYWNLHHRCDLSPEERADDLECLAGLRRTRRAPFPIKQSTGYEYQFDPDQDTKIEAGDFCRIAQQRTVSIQVEEIDRDAGRVVLKVGDKPAAKLGGDPPERLCLVRFEHVGTSKLEAAIQEIAEDFLEGVEELPAAIEDFLLRRPPAMREYGGGSLLREDERAEEALLRLIPDLDGSTLCIQGPPGSGKTRNAARAIVALAERGKRVGVTSNSHRAIVNLMRACVDESGDDLEYLKIKKDAAEDLAADRVAPNLKAALPRLGRTAVVGATAWDFADWPHQHRLDYLFVDEAGQVSVANLVAMSWSARNLVLVGDQMQLAQPLQGAHPGESGASTLDYLLRDVAVVPPDRGIFLDRTHRLHPDLCRFVSGVAYEGALESAPGTEKRIVRLPAGGGRWVRREAGLVFVPVEHEGNTQCSDEEVERIREIVDELLGRQVIGDGGQVRHEPLGLDDILFVAPYNMQVHRLREALGAGAKVGSVDLFQGQQARVVIVSMCSSDAAASPRGIEFLLDRNRINVAVSRAQSLAIVVGSPALARAPCSTLDQMKLVNLYCRLVQEGSMSA